MNNTQPSALAQLWSAVAATAVLGVVCCGAYPLLVWGVAQTVLPHQANGSLLKRDGSPTTDDKQAVGSALLGQSFAAPGYFHPRPSAAGNGYDAANSGGSNLGPLSDKLLNGLPAAPATQPATQPATWQYDGVRLRTIKYAVENGLAFKLYRDGAEVPLRQFQDAAGNLNEEALVEAFPHPTAADATAGLTVGKPDDHGRVTGPVFARADGTPVRIPADAVTASASGLDPHVSVENAALQVQRIADARHVTVKQVADVADACTDGRGLGFLGDAGVNVLRANLELDAKYPLPAPPATQPGK